jgi:hypothetical protein
MPLFSFDTFDGEDVLRDEEGEDFASLYAAEVEAEDAAREMAAAVIIGHGLIDSRELRVRDAGGAVVFVVRYKDILGH